MLARCPDDNHYTLFTRPRRSASNRTRIRLPRFASEDFVAAFRRDGLVCSYRKSHANVRTVACLHRKYRWISEVMKSNTCSGAFD